MGKKYDGVRSELWHKLPVIFSFCKQMSKACHSIKENVFCSCSFSFGLFSLGYVFLYLFFIYCCSSTVVSIFAPLLPLTPAIPTSHPWYYPLPLVLSMCPSYMFLKTLPLPHSIIPSHLPSGHCQFVLNFTISHYILLACLFCISLFLRN